MISFKGQNINEAWREAVRGLYGAGREIPERDLYRFSPAMISVADTRGEHYDDLYHFPVSEIAQGNRYFVTGEGEEHIADERIKILRRRLFGSREISENENMDESGDEYGEDEYGEEYEDDGGGEDGEEKIVGEERESEIERVISYLENLKNNPSERSAEDGEAAISLSRPEDAENENAPGIQAIFFSLDDSGALKTQVYRREVDGYRELLPDMSRFAALQHFVADRLGVPAGKYSYFSDALHFHNDDRELIDLLLAP